MLRRRGKGTKLATAVGRKPNEAREGLRAKGLSRTTRLIRPCSGEAEWRTRHRLLACPGRDKVFNIIVRRSTNLEGLALLSGGSQSHTVLMQQLLRCQGNIAEM